MESYNNQDGVGYRFTLEQFNGKELKYKLMADQIRWDSTLKNWKIQSYSIKRIKGLYEYVERGGIKDTVLNMSPSDFERKDNSIASLTNTEMKEYLEKERKRGASGLEAYEIEYYKRFAMSFSTFILVLIAVSLCSRKVRGGVGAQLGIGIGSSFAYILLMQFTTTFALKGGLHPAISVWIPNVLFTIYGLYLLKIAPK